MILKESELIKVQINTSKKMLPTNEYLTDVENENFIYIKDKFFIWEPLQKVKTLNVWSWLFTATTNTISTYVWQPVIDVEFPIKNLTEDFLTLWYACMTLERVDWQLTPVYQPAEKYFNRDWIDYILRIYQKIEDYKTHYYYLITSFNGWIIENHLYETALAWVYDLQEVELDTIQETANLDPIIKTWLEKCFFKIQEDELEQHPLSMIDKIKSIVYSIDRKILMMDLQFLQNVESFILLKWIQLPTKLFDKYNDNWKISFQDLWRIVQGDEWSSIEFINNENQLIDRAMSHNNTQLRQISSITTIPMDFLGWLWTAWAVWEWSRLLLHWAFNKTIQSIRDLFDKTLMEVLRVARITDQYQWDDVMSRDRKDIIEEIKIARETWLLSRYNAIKRYNDYSDEETVEELRLLENDLIINNTDNGNQSNTTTETNNEG